MRWAVQYLSTGGKWIRISQSDRFFRKDAVELVEEWNEVQPHVAHRLIRIVTKSEKLRAAIVRELREVVASHRDAKHDEWSALRVAATLETIANRIERGEVG